MPAAITVQEIMHSPVETVAPSISVRAAATTLRDGVAGSLVVYADGEPVGIVTDADITRLVSEGHDPDETSVEAIMSQPAVTVEADASVEAAAETLGERQIERLPVVEDGEVAGVVTTTALSNSLSHLAEATRAALPGMEQKRRQLRPDTAYEREEWSFEYVSADGTIEVGDSASFSKRLSDDDVRAFADASGDTNRLHLDAEFAAGTRFGERIAHGTLVAGLISAALARLPGLTIYLSQSLRFLAPVGLDERLTAECNVVEKLDGNKFRLRTTVTDADEKTIIDGEAVVISDPLPESTTQG